MATLSSKIAPSGVLTGNQTITLSGDLSGSGTTSINAQIAANVVGANELNVSGNGTTSQYLRSDGDGSFSWATPASGSLELISTTTVSSAVAQVDFTSGFDNTAYSSYKFVLQGVRPSTDGASLQMRTSTNGGSTFDSSGYKGTLVMDFTTSTTIYSSATTLINIGLGVGSLTTEYYSGEVTLIPYVSSGYSAVTGLGFAILDDGSQAVCSVAAQRSTTSEINGIRFLFSSGNVAAGTIYMYGVRK